MTRKINMKQITAGATMIVLIFITFLSIYGYQIGIFESQESFKKFIIDCGVLGNLLFIAFQAIQVIIPILPGPVACIAGVLAFGPIYGFLYNYIGICIGSIAAFMLSKKYGIQFVKKIMKPQQYDKYSAWLEKGKKFEIFFSLAILLPVAPDDLLCFLAGLSKMSLKKFTSIILLGKPIVLVMYSYAIAEGVDYLLNLL